MLAICSAASSAMARFSLAGMSKPPSSSRVAPSPMPSSAPAVGDEVEHGRRPRPCARDGCSWRSPGGCRGRAGCAWSRRAPRRGTPRRPSSASIPRGSGARPPRRSRSPAGRRARPAPAPPGPAARSSSVVPGLGQLQLVEDAEFHRRLSALRVSPSNKVRRAQALGKPLLSSRPRTSVREPGRGAKNDAQCLRLLDPDISLVANFRDDSYRSESMRSIMAGAEPR